MNSLQKIKNKAHLIFEKLCSDKIKTYRKTITDINNREKDVSNMSDEQIYAEFKKIKQLLHNKQYNSHSELYKNSVNQVFAIVREVSKRVRGERHFDEQIMAGLALNDGYVIEMKTGQGKTISAILSAIYKSMYNKKVHIVTANDYLAKRDLESMSKIFDFLQINAGHVSKETKDHEKIINYQKEIIYVSNQELSFDFLRSNLKHSYQDMQMKKDMMQFVIIDELDSVLIDNAKIPTIIGSSCNSNKERHTKAYDVVKNINRDDVVINIKEHDVYIKREKSQKIESLISEVYQIPIEHIYNYKNIKNFFYIDRALRAEYLLRNNHDYIVQNNKVKVIDINTGRVANERKFAMGIQAALEAKENVEITTESITSNCITAFSLFHTYDNICGMTGTIITDKKEMYKIHNLEIIQIPKTEKSYVKHNVGKIFMNKQMKYNAIIDEVKTSLSKKQPILIGTANIQESEEISNLLTKNYIQYNVLNAKHLEKEAQIISNAGIPSTVTISTNIAGRGTDISLGGNIENQIMNINEQINKIQNSENQQQIDKLLIDKTLLIKHKNELKKIAKNAGGLKVIITQRQDNRRSDRQLSGRTGRRDDNGEVSYYISLQDEIFRHYPGIQILLSKIIPKDNKVNYIIDFILTNMQKGIENNMFTSRTSVINQNYITDQSYQKFIELRVSVLKDEIDIEKTIQQSANKILESCKTSNQKLKKAYEYVVSSNISNQITHYKLYDYFKNTLDKITQYSNEKGKKQMKKIIISIIDEMWMEYISLKDIYKRSIQFNYKVDYMIFYNSEICKLLTKVFQSFEIKLLKNIYNNI